MAQKKPTAKTTTKATQSAKAASVKSTPAKKVVAKAATAPKASTKAVKAPAVKAPKATTLVAKAASTVTKTKVNAGTSKIAAPKLAAKRPAKAKATKIS